MINSVSIRPAREEDAKAIATVNLETWQSAYADIFPADKLASLFDSLDLRIERWVSILRGAERLSVAYVAEVNGKVVGFANAGEQVKAEYPQQAEMFAIYILPEHHGKGIGRRLFTATAEKLQNIGLSSLLLWVLADNLSSRGFYERLGGRFCGEDEYLRWGQSYRLAGYCWDSLDTLTRK